MPLTIIAPVSSVTRLKLAVVLLLIAFLQHVHCYSSYLNNNPNGQTVGGTLGHPSGGGGTRSSFGNAFSSAGNQWTTSLCLAGGCAVILSHL